MRSESAGFEQGSRDVVGEVAEAKAEPRRCSSRPLIVSVGRSVRGAGTVEEREDARGSLVQRPAELAEPDQAERNPGGDGVEQVLHLALGIVGCPVGGDHALVDALGHEVAQTLGRLARPRGTLGRRPRHPARSGKFLRKYATFTLLVIDEWLLDRPTESMRHMLLEMMESRYGETSAVFCTQYSQKDWHPRLGSGVHEDAVMDRIIHNTVWVETGTYNTREHTALAAA